ncbi:hypothetical protein, partial [Pseudonocardia zijingensis]|uniref:hypothetical protein n=1 Tax=Pseudonocardia zijingensis TaxID=153376 RepID=UPI003610251C
EAREHLVAGHRWVVLERLVDGLGSARGRVAVDELVAAEARVRELVESGVAADVVAVAVAAREEARRVVDEVAGGALGDAVRLGVSDRAVARVLRRPVGVAALLLGPARRVWAAGSDLDGSWKELVERRARLTEADRAIEDLLATGVRWLLNPVDGGPVPADAAARIAEVLGVPEALVGSWALAE